MTEAPEPKDKLDATTNVVVNGPEDAPFDWRQVDWRRAEGEVRRLRQRIFTASQAGDLARVRQLQKLMLRSRANTLISVRRVTERNAGRLTAGVDGEVVLTPEAKARLVDRIHHRSEPFKAMPVRRVYIPKRGSSTKRRPLGIPVISIAAIRHGSRVRWSPSGKRGSSRGPMDSGPAAAATTRSKRSSTPPRARTRSGGGRLTQTSQGHSTASPTTTFWPCSARSPLGG